MHEPTLISLPKDPKIAHPMALQFILQECLQLSHSQTSTGAISRLLFYCNYLVDTSSLSTEALHQAVQALTHIPLLESTPLRQKFLDLFDALFPFFSEERLNENLLSYCLEKREALNEAFGLRKIETLLLRLFPEGKETLRAHLKKRYEAREFFDYSKKQDDLLAFIEF